MSVCQSVVRLSSVNPFNIRLSKLRRSAPELEKRLKRITFFAFVTNSLQYATGLSRGHANTFPGRHVIDESRTRRRVEEERLHHIFNLVIETVKRGNTNVPEKA